MSVFRSLLIVCTVALVWSDSGLAKNSHPFSGRRLRRGHWLTCDRGADEAYRRDPFFHKDSPQQEVAAYVPKFDGEFSFEVKDTWEDYVTKSGYNCAQCGETCQGEGNDKTCSCDFCTWTEKETFYAPWSTQKVQWHAEYIQDQAYLQRRQDWINKGKPALSRNASDLDKLMIFDPERPLNYFLFPGEVESVEASNGVLFGGAEGLRPEIHIDHPRYQYSYNPQSTVGEVAKCDDRDFQISSQISAGKRLITTTPNSVEFRKNWIQGAKNSKGELTDETAKFELTDISAMRYEDQNVHGNYKDTLVAVNLWHAHNFWWFLDTKAGRDWKTKDVDSIIQWHKENPNDKSPPVATYELKTSDLLRGRWTGSEFHLAAGNTYEVCTYMLRLNNIYYKTRKWYGAYDWSEPNCSMFKYNPDGGKDLRSGGQKVEDFLSHLVGFGIF